MTTELTMLVEAPPELLNALRLPREESQFDFPLISPACTVSSQHARCRSQHALQMRQGIARQRRRAWLLEPARRCENRSANPRKMPPAALIRPSCPANTKAQRPTPLVPQTPFRTHCMSCICDGVSTPWASLRLTKGLYKLAHLLAGQTPQLLALPLHLDGHQRQRPRSRRHIHRSQPSAAANM